MNTVTFNRNFDPIASDEDKNLRQLGFKSGSGPFSKMAQSPIIEWTDSTEVMRDQIGESLTPEGRLRLPFDTFRVGGTIYFRHDDKHRPFKAWVRRVASGEVLVAVELLTGNLIVGHFEEAGDRKFVMKSSTRVGISGGRVI